MLIEISTQTALLFSLLSVWVLISLFLYLGSYTGKRCFRIWTAGWLFYAVSLTLQLWHPENPSSILLNILQSGCISTAAVLMFWGSFDFLGLPTTQRLIGLTILFNSMWSLATGVQFPGTLWGTLPAFILFGAAAVFTGISLKSRIRASERSATLLTFGFGLWALYLVIFPFLKLPDRQIAIGLLFASVLQLFIAISMVICVLEDARRNLSAAESKLAGEIELSRSRLSLVHETEQGFQRLFDDVNEAVVIVSPKDLTLLASNDAARKLFQLEEPLSGTALNTYCSLRNQSNQSPASNVELARLLPENPPLDLTFRDGSKVRAEVRCHAIRLRGQDALQLVFLEVAQRTTLARQLRHDSKISALGQVISGVAHELNNPLAAIKGYSDLLLLTAHVDHPTRQSLLKISQESNRAAKLVHDLLAFARPETPHIEPTRLNDLVRAFVEQRRTDLESRGIEFHLKLAEASPLILANSDQIQQVLAHLLNNAIHALDDWDYARKIEISTRLSDSTVQLLVEDSGPGIPDEVAPRIFEPFFTTKPLGTGTGLGLSLCYTIVLQHRGKLYHRESASGGASMVVELPSAAVADLESGTEDAKIATPNFGPKKETSAATSVLVVDDEPSVGALIRDMLSLHGYDVTAHHAPAEALAELQKKHFDVIVSDFRMPGMNGGQFYDCAVTLDPSYATRFLLITGDVMADDAHEFLQRTKTRHLLKPFQIAALQTAVAEIIESPSSELRAIGAA